MKLSHKVKLFVLQNWRALAVLGLTAAVLVQLSGKC